MADHSAYFLSIWRDLQQAGVYRPRPNPTFGNPRFDQAGSRVLIVRLSPFRDVDRSASHLVLHQLVRRALPDAFIDVAFFPPRHDRRRLAAAGIPLVVGTQSFCSADSFDVVLVSNSYLLELINLPYLMARSGIPLWASERNEGWPPFILGGSNATATQSIVSGEGDCLMDALFFGEGEDQVGPLVRAIVRPLADTKRARLARAETEVDGLWLAGSPASRAIRPATVKSPGSDHLLTQFPSLNGAEAGTGRLQISFGCPAMCSFCYEGYDRKPYREVSHADVLAAAGQLKRSTGSASVELHSFNFNTHSSVLPILYDLNQMFDRVGFMSQRVDILATSAGLLEAEFAAGKRHYTFGVEGISEKQRAFLHKSVDVGAVRDVLRETMRRRPRQVKLFYVLTGHEDEADLAEFREFVGWLKSVCAGQAGSPRVTFSFGYLVRMPFTPLRYDRLLLDPDHWRQIVGPVKSACETNGFEFRLAMEWDEYCASQVLAVGGHWLSSAIVELAESGHCYDGGLTPGCWEDLKSWMNATGRWSRRFMDEKTSDYVFSMEFVSPRIGSAFLYRQFEAARAHEDAGYCLGNQSGSGRCAACGACEDGAERERIVRHQIAPVPPGFTQRLEAMVKEKRSRRPAFVHARIPPAFAGATAEWLGAAAGRAILLEHPSQVGNLLSTREALFTVAPASQRYPIFAGETVLALRAWDSDALVAELLASAAPAGNVGPPREAPEGEIQFLGPVPDFEPGKFNRASLELRLPTDRFPEAGRRLVHFLRKSYVACNLRRRGEVVALDLPPKAVKKRVVFEGEFDETAEETVIRLQVGAKFDLGGFLASFGGKGNHHHARVAVTNLVW